MGGEKETVVEQKGKGGEAKLSSFRIHENNGEVHFHDDKNKLKCVVPMGAWWKAWDRLRGEPGFWNYVDISNNAAITVETKLDANKLDVILYVEKITVSEDYAKLNTFSKRK